LLGYIGIDQWLEGIRTYRWLDAKMNFTGRPLPTGATIRYDIRIRSFTRHGGTLLFVTDFDCDVNGQRFLEIRDCTAGFFTDEELEKGQGLASVPYNGVSQDTNLPRPLSKKTELTEDDLTAWQHGDLATCFGDSHAGMEKLHPSLRLVPGPMRMIDRIVHLAPPCADSDHLVAEKWLDPGDWYLRSHFKDAPVFAGPCMVEGCFQALQCYALYLGLPDGMENARFSPADDCRMEVKFRGQVPAERGTFTMRMRATAIEYGEVRSLQADFDLVYKKRIIGRVTGLGIKLEGARLSPAKQTILGREISTV
jgi:3-hydroxymyristoyl/3-hydroxydecanoyl-(acyl carrier protein) dehydratase